MGRTKQPTPIRKTRRVKPAETPQARENQLIGFAYDLAEQRLLDGTATSQEVVHFLKLGSTKERLEREKLEIENELMKAKIAYMESNQRVEELYANAIKAMTIYSGQEVPNEEEE